MKFKVASTWTKLDLPSFGVPADKKLPSLYLLDSIVKNFGQEYVKHFSLRLPQVYCEAYRQVQPNLHSVLQGLFGTWSKIFPPSVLSNIEAQLQSSPAVNNQQSFANHLGAYDFRGPILGAHVTKPQSLQQMEHSSSIMDNLGGDRLDSTGTVGNTRGGGLNEWQQKRFSSDNWNIFQTSKTYNLNDEQRQSPRALIEAYGCHKSREIPSTKLLLVEQPGRNGFGSKFPLASWQDTEEEEFDWKDVNPGLVDCSRNSSSMQSSVRFSKKRKLSNDLSNPSQYPFTMGAAPPAVNAHGTRPSGLNTAFPLQKRPNVGHGPNKTQFIHDQLPNQPGPVSSNLQNHGQTPQLQFLPPQIPSSTQISHGSSLQGHGASISTPISNPLPDMLGQSLYLHGGILPPLCSSLPTAPSQTMSHPHADASVTSQPPPAYLDLLSSLVNHGVISVTNPPTNPPAGLDFIGTEFDPDILKVRHEGVISALYGDLPRQCRSCGLRFKRQDEHSRHMDWHVTRNRMSKSRKQKGSQKWFASGSMWLSGAEASGKESIPRLLAAEETEEMKDEEELGVPAEEDQSRCALCGEGFDEFYSHEMEEWMYRGATYLKAPMGTTLATLDRHQLGPIVHSKCRSDSDSTMPSTNREPTKRVVREKECGSTKHQFCAPLIRTY
ncbi:polyadenylation and cleavage factor homolog 4-like isoform X2 [Arachis hypogaea]|uniref:polyadenylation and cleavage factor homolog 4-like isoform X2 n=1 Tax=Arachis hypogaea TaxID=3818 RepID=UPI000DED1A01|nr:polyadenylation and cleavage factor homolog 4-like isoform X2 [Arachis hypogaea]XP_025697795.1 polyadenylation and cleavage factor homolog 4-like isoform X2 [Arachis hypogaea]